MKKNNIYRALFPILGVSLAILAVLAINFVFAAGIGAAGVTYAVAPVGTPIVSEPVTTENVNAANADLNTNYVSQKITEMKPSATPLDTIMRSVGESKKIEAFRTEFYSVDTRSLTDTVKTAFVSAGDGSLTTNLEVNYPAMWTEDDTCKFNGIAGSDGDDLVCLIIGKTATEITIQPINGLPGSGTTADELILPDIPIDTVIVRMGNAKNELDAQTDPYAIIPAKDYNYCQLFMAQVEEGTYQRDHSKEVEWSFSDYEAMNIYDMKAVMEYSFLFGYRAKFYDKKAVSKERYTTGGLTRSITKGLTYGTGGANRTVTDADFVTWTKSIFTGNSGSEMRIFFAGESLVENISLLDSVQKQQTADNTMVKWGITWRKIETNFGTLLLKHHKGFDLAGYGDNGIVLDVNNVAKQSFLPTEYTKLDLIKSGQKKANATVIAETSCLVLTYPDTHAIITPKA